MRPKISISIVSHNQGDLVSKLLSDFETIGLDDNDFEVIVTKNVAEKSEFFLDKIPLRLICNETPKGFGENHNAAFKQAAGTYFCVMNPDVRLKHDPFPALIEHIKSLNLSVTAPRIINPQGKAEDNARPFPKFSTIIKKLFGSREAARYPESSIPELPDWIAGMFMVFDAGEFARVGCFDERYFLYYEDVDICARLYATGKAIGYCREAEAIHDARRDSHRKFRYMWWHVSSMLRFWRTHASRLARNI